MATEKNAAEAQGMSTNVTHVLHQNPDNVLRNIHTLADTHAKTGVRLCCGVAQFLIVRAYHFDDAQRWNIDRSRDYLKTQLNAHGLKQASAYRYIATGHKLAQVMVRKFGLGGVIGDILRADNENKAFSMIERCVIGFGYLPAPDKPIKPWQTDAEHKPRLSMDVLRVNLGLDQLDATLQPGYKPPEAPKVDANNPGAALAGTEPAVPATKASPKSIVARLKADKDLVKSIPEDVVIGAASIIGREKMAERLVSLMTLEECTKLQSAIMARMTVLANTPKEEKTEPANDAATGTASQLPSVSPVETEDGATTVSPRSRKRNRKAA